MIYLKKIEDFIWNKRKEETRKKYVSAMNILTEEDAINYVNDYCSDWLYKPVKIIRGIHNYNNFNYFQSEPVERFSRDNYNFYTLIMDNSPKWKNYPKRSKSFICSINRSRLGATKYIVIPKNNAKWGVAPHNDIYISFKKQIRKIFNSTMDIEDFFNYINIISNDSDIILDDTNYNDFKIKIKELQNKFLNYKNNKSFSSRKNLIINKLNESGDWFKIILDILNPDKNGFKLMTTNQLYDINNKLNYEIWTDSSCLFIKKNNYEFFEKLDQKYNSNTLKIIK